MAVIIGKAGRRISRETALAHVAGYACYNDGSIRDWQRHTSQFAPGQEFRRHRRVRAVDGHDGRNPRHQQADDCDPPQRRRGAGRTISDLVFDVPP
jgi:2-keto-4-pentenoate hydratase/2-oxohepta-3-ene-1,7-dioic acid hydratase in catechol pathway